MSVISVVIFVWNLIDINVFLLCLEQFDHFSLIRNTVRRIRNDQRRFVEVMEQFLKRRMPLRANIAETLSVSLISE